MIIYHQWNTKIYKKLRKILSGKLLTDQTVALAKFACNTRDSANNIFSNHQLIKAFSAMTTEQAKAYGASEGSINGIKYKLSHFSETLNNELLTEICPTIQAISNDYDSNFENLSNQLIGVVNTLLNPLSLFGPSDALSL
jgi:hypothetical protein